MRFLVGLVVASCVAWVAWRARSLSRSGAMTAAVMGTAAVATGWNWALILILYFVSSSALSRFGKQAKERRTSSVVEKGGARDWLQVCANGFVFLCAALAMLLRPNVRWLALGAGALAASAADTWATEIGTLYGSSPRSILTFRPVMPGTSGGVSLAGTLGSLAGAAFMALVATVASRTPIFWPIFVGGVAGAVIDSLLGATVQSRRWCDTCHKETERHVHDCGSTTTSHRGIAWFDNDVVNFASAALGGLLAAALVR